MLSTPISTDILRGVIDLEHTADGVRPHRLPEAVRTRFPDPQLTMAEGQPAGARLLFRTRATAIELDVHPTKRAHVGLPSRPDGRYDLLVDGVLTGRTTVEAGDVFTVDMAAGAAWTTPGPSGTVRFDGLHAESKIVEIWLPHNETTELRALRTDAPVEPVGDRGRRVWLHHGSSVSQGSNANNPTETWPALASLRGAVELINLGFSGSALLDPFVARVLRDTPADLISVKLGINVVNADLMRLRAFTPAVHGFLDTIREGHQETPLLVVSPVHCPIHEDTPGPGAFDPEAMRAGEVRFRATGDPAEVAAGRLTLGVVRDELARIVEERRGEDGNLHYLDGRTLYGPADFAVSPLPDALHPDADTHRRMGERFAEAAFAAGSPFTRAE